MQQFGGTDEGEGPAAQHFDEAWAEGAKRSETDIRRYQAPPRHEPAPWRSWTPPQEPDSAVRPPAARPNGGPRVAGVLLVVLLLVVIGILVWRVLPGSGSSATKPGAVVPPADSTTTTAIAPTTTPAPTTTAARPLPWSPATTLPVTGPDATRADVFATVRVGTCMAEAANLSSIIIVPCSGPHTDEVTLVRDLTSVFAATPTNDQIQALNSQLCPSAAQTWTGGAAQQYSSGYLWQFQDGVPGQVVRSFACTVMLAGHSPFSGTLRHAAA